MKNSNIKYFMSLLTVLLLLPIINFNLYCDHDDGHDDGHGHGDGGGETRITGLITAITANSISVDTLVFEVNSDTKIEGEGRHFTFDSLKIGDSVEVRGETKDSVLTATEIKLLQNENGDDHHGEHNSEFSLKGIITELSDSSLTVDGKNIIFTDSTVIQFENHDSASKSDLAVGQKVEVEGNIVDSNYFALSIKIEEENHHDVQEFEITGTILSIADNSFTVDTLTIVVDANTEIEKQHAGHINFSDLQVGDSVEVKGTIDSSVYLAKKIEVKTTEQVKVEEEGDITDVSDSSVTVNANTFRITADTRITKEDNPVDKSELIVGLSVKIKGFILDSNLIAEEIEIKDNNEHHDSTSRFELHGEITSINSNTITVEGVDFIVDSNTVIRKDESGEIQLSDLATGMRVEVHGSIIDSVKIASKIVVLGGHSEEHEIKGEITAILDSTFTVNNTVITVTPETIIFGSNDTTLQFSDLAVGNFVKVKLNIVDSINFALRIEVKQEHHNHNDSDEVSDIDQVFNDHFSANSKSYYIDDATKVFNQYGREISYNELKPGMKAYIYEDIKNNQLYAGRIDVQQDGVSEVITDVSSLVNIVNAPNPFNDATTLILTMPDAGLIAIALYNEAGGKVLDIYNGFVGKGENDFSINSNSNLGSGVYYIKLVYNGGLYVRAIARVK